MVACRTHHFQPVGPDLLAEMVCADDQDLGPLMEVMTKHPGGDNGGGDNLTVIELQPESTQLVRYDFRGP